MHAKKGLLASALVIISLFFLAPNSVSSYFFEDEFDGSYSQPSFWESTPNQGSVSFSSDSLQLINSVGAKSFPYVRTINEITPAFGSFYIDLAFNYLSLGNFGDGISFSNNPPTYGTVLEPDHKNYILFLVWQDSPLGLRFYTTTCPDVNPFCLNQLSQIHSLGIDNLGIHQMRVSFDDLATYRLYVDDFTNPVFTSAIGQTRQIGMWMGHSETTNTSDSWSNFQVDYVRVTQGSPVVTPTPTPIPTSTPTPIPTPTPPLPTPTPTPIPTAQVPNFYQFSSPWGGDIYDNAKTWAKDDPSISRWGCAVTSAAMVLKYYGFNADPRILNNWLKSQKDGYLRNGLANWLAISRYSKLNPNADSESLEYYRFGSDTNKLDELLAENSPVILKEPGHFVVAKAKQGSTYDINDPAYINRTSLQSYGNSFQAMGVYKPSHTDLSYFMFVVDPAISLELIDAQGETVVGQEFIDEGIKSDSGKPAESGKALKTLMFPKPQSGEYVLEVTGDLNSYSLDSYIYDNNGKVSLLSSGGLINEGEGDSYSIATSGKIKVREKTNLDKLKSDVIDAYKLGKIKSKREYKSIIDQIKNIRKAKDHHKTWLGKLLLLGLDSRLRLMQGWTIDKQTVKILTAQIEAILRSW